MSGMPVGVKRGRHCRPLPEEPAAAAAAVAAAVAAGEGTRHSSNAVKLPLSALPNGSLTDGRDRGGELRAGDVQSHSLGQTVDSPALPTLVPTSTSLEQPESPKPRWLCLPRTPQAWKGRLRRGLAAGREPSEMFQFPALGR